MLPRSETERCRNPLSRLTLVGAVHLFLTTSRGDILLLRRANTGYQDGSYSVPSGHIEQGESATASMVRETSEEIGITIPAEALSLVHVMHRRSVGTDCSNSERVDFFFTAAGFDGDPVNREPSKCDELGWFPVSGLPGNVVGYVRNAFEYYRHGEPYSEQGWDLRCPQCGSVGSSGGNIGVGEHRYFSTGCLHGEHVYCQSMLGIYGVKRPGQCKFCEAKCVCVCHREVTA